MKFKEALEFLESVELRRVVRKGKIIHKKFSTRKGYKLDPKTGKEVRMSPEEMKKRARSAKKAAKKRKRKLAQIQLKQQKSLKKIMP